MATATSRQTTSDRRNEPQRQSDLSMETSGSRSRQTGQGLGRQRQRSNDGAEKLARGLGWFSIGLGTAELLAPRAIAKISGIEPKTGLIRLFGLREICSGIAIFAQGKKPAGAVWSRVAGDALDLAALGKAFTSPNSRKGPLTFATANVLAVTALDVICAQKLSSNGSANQGTAVTESLIIDRSPEELYQFWHNFENLPRFMRQLQSVEAIDERRSHWVASGPGGMRVEWDAEITDDRPNQLIAWRSLPGSDVETFGSVRFERAPGNRGTLVEVEMNYNPPAGFLGHLAATLTGDNAAQQVKEALRSFKQLIETGEVTLSDGTIWDNGYLTQRPARPIAESERPTSQTI